MDIKDVQVALVDDHVLLRRGLAGLIASFDGYAVLFDAGSGKEFIEQLASNEVPDIVLMDINMPDMDGYETTSWLRENYPACRVLALSMYDNENALTRMFNAGARGYILKDCDPGELKTALDAISSRGFYQQGR